MTVWWFHTTAGGRRRAFAVGWAVYSAVVVLALITGTWDADRFLPYPRPDAFRTHEISAYVYAWLTAMANLPLWMPMRPLTYRRLGSAVGVMLWLTLGWTAWQGHQVVGTLAAGT